MARPCGCSGGGCTARGINGIEVTGTCGVNDPLTIGLSENLGAGCEPVMDCVGNSIGAGLSYSDAGNRISTYVSGDEGNMLGYGSDGGLLSTGSPDPGLGGVTVASLPAQNVLGGTYGAGYTQYPEGTRKSYEAAMAFPQITVIHVPIHRGNDGTLWALDNRNANTYAAVSNTLDTWGQKDGQDALVRPSGTTPDWHDGYFGYYAPTQNGFTELQEVLRITMRRKVLYLEVKDLGGSSSTELPEQTLRLLGDLIVKWGLQKQVIIGAEMPSSNADLDGIVAGLGYCKSLGIEIAGHLTSPTMAAAVPPQNLVALGATWAFLSFTIPPATIGTYRDAGLSVMMLAGDRQSHWALQNAWGVRGLLSTDPVYTGAPTYGYQYRPVNLPTSAAHPWSRVNSGADFGRTGYNGSIVGAHARFRGAIIAGVPNILQFGPEALPSGSSNYLIPVGRWNPIYDPNTPEPPVGNPGSPTNYDIECGVSVTSAQSVASGMAIGLFFGMPSDSRIYDRGASTNDTRGYSVEVLPDGRFRFRRYDGVAGNIAYTMEWSSGWSSISAERRIHVAVRPGQVTISRAEAIGGSGSRVFNAATGGGDAWRGPYLYLSFFRTSGHAGYCRFHNLKVTNY